MSDNKGDKALVVIDEIVNTTPVELSNRVAVVYGDVQNAADKILESAKIEDLGDAAAILLDVKTHLKDLKTNTINWPIIRNIQEYYRRTEFAVAKMIKRRQTVKSALEESKARYEIKRNNLENGIESIRAYGEEAALTTKKIEMAIQTLDEENLALQDELNKKNPNTDSQIITQLNHAINIRRGIIADLTSFKTIHEGTVIQIATQLQEREALFMKMGSMRPSLDTLIKNQLTALITQAPVRAAIKEVKDTIRGIREIAIQTSKMCHDDAVLTAEIVNDPIIDDQTINTVTDNIIAMCNDTQKAITESLERQKNVTTTAKHASDRLRQTIQDLQKKSIK